MDLVRIGGKIIEFDLGVGDIGPLWHDQLPLVLDAPAIFEVRTRVVDVDCIVSEDLAKDDFSFLASPFRMVGTGTSENNFCGELDNWAENDGWTS